MPNTLPHPLVHSYKTIPPLNGEIRVDSMNEEIDPDRLYSDLFLSEGIDGRRVATFIKIMQVSRAVRVDLLSENELPKRIEELAPLVTKDEAIVVLKRLGDERNKTALRKLPKEELIHLIALYGYEYGGEPGCGESLVNWIPPWDRKLDQTPKSELPDLIDAALNIAEKNVEKTNHIDNLVTETIKEIEARLVVTKRVRETPPTLPAPRMRGNPNGAADQREHRAAQDRRRRKNRIKHRRKLGRERNNPQPVFSGTW